MRKRHYGSLLGTICIASGTMIILSMVLPSGFWWFLLGVGLIGFGFYFNSRCC